MKKNTKNITSPQVAEEAMSALLRLIEGERIIMKVANEWQEELLDEIAQCWCRRDSLDIKRMMKKLSIASSERVSWKDLEQVVKKRYLRNARAVLKVAALFVTKKRNISLLAERKRAGAGEQND